LKTIQFATRVQLLASTGRVLGSVPAREAERLKQAGATIHDSRGGFVRGIQLSERLPAPSKAPSPPSIHQYMGQRYTYKQPLDAGNGQTARCIDLKFIHPDDHDLFCLSVTDNLKEADR
jgi:hypothetical protein